MSENDPKAVLAALDKRLARALKKLSAVEQQASSKKSPCSNVDTASSALPPFITESLADLTAPSVVFSADEEARSVENPCSRETIDSDQPTACLKERCLNMSMWKASSIFLRDEIGGSRNTKSKSRSFSCGESTPSIHSEDPSESHRSLSPIISHLTRKRAALSSINLPLVPTLGVTQDTITGGTGLNPRKISAYPKGQVLINQAYESTDAELHRLADELMHIRSLHTRKKQLLEGEKRQLLKEVEVYKNEKLLFHKASRKFQLEWEVEKCNNLEERQKLDRMRQEVNAEKLRNSQMTRKLDERDLSMMEQANRLKMNDQFGEEPYRDLWKARLREKHKNAVKERKKYIKLNNELAEHKRKLDQEQENLESEKRNIDRQKHLFRAAQKRLHENRLELSLEKKQVDICAQKLQRIKLCISNETTELLAQKKTFENKMKNMETEKQKLQSNKEAFFLEKDRIRKLEAFATNELKQLMEKRLEIAKKEADMKSLRPEIMKEKEVCARRAKVNLEKSNELEAWEQSIKKLIQAKQFERKAATVIKKFEEQQRSGHSFQQQGIVGVQKQHR